MKRILLNGCCGKMGRVLASLIDSRSDCTVVAGVDRCADPSLPFPVYDALDKVAETPDVIIDFSHPDALGDLLGYCRLHGTALVLATTGYTAGQVDEIRAAATQFPLFFSFNMSLGINLLAQLAKTAAGFLGDSFDIEIVEKHHNQKIDAPSGTALMLADAINGDADEPYRYVYDRHAVRRKRTPREIGIHSVRGGSIVGEHEIIFAGQDEVITLSHSATSKQIFAVGAVNAACYLAGKPAGLYDMSRLFADGRED